MENKKDMNKFEEELYVREHPEDPNEKTDRILDEISAQIPDKTTMVSQKFATLVKFIGDELRKVSREESFSTSLLAVKVGLNVIPEPLLNVLCAVLESKGYNATIKIADNTSSVPGAINTMYDTSSVREFCSIIIDWSVEDEKDKENNN